MPKFDPTKPPPKREPVAPPPRKKAAYVHDYAAPVPVATLPEMRFHPVVTQRQKEALLVIGRKITQGLQILPGDFIPLALDTNRLNIPAFAELLRMTPLAVRNLVAKGMPENSDGTLCAPECILWYISTQTSGVRPANGGGEPMPLSGQKTMEEIKMLQLKQEKLQAEVDETKARSVPTEKHERVKSALIESFTSYLRNSLNRNLAVLRAVHEADADKEVEKFIVALTAQMAQAVAQAEG